MLNCGVIIPYKMYETELLSKENQAFLLMENDLKVRIINQENKKSLIFHRAGFKSAYNGNIIALLPGEYKLSVSYYKKVVGYSTTQTLKDVSVPLQAQPGHLYLIKRDLIGNNQFIVQIEDVSNVDSYNNMINKKLFGDWNEDTFK